MQVFLCKRTNNATSTKPHAAIAFTTRILCSQIYLCIGPAASNVEVLNQFLSWNLHLFCLLYQYSKYSIYQTLFFILFVMITHVIDL